MASMRYPVKPANDICPAVPLANKSSQLIYGSNNFTMSMGMQLLNNKPDY